MASMSLDNTWMQAQDRARKAGRLLGEVLEKRVQGERPVVLVGFRSSCEVTLITPDWLVCGCIHCSGSFTLSCLSAPSGRLPG